MGANPGLSALARCLSCHQAPAPFLAEFKLEGLFRGSSACRGRSKVSKRGKKVFALVIRALDSIFCSNVSLIVSGKKTNMKLAITLGLLLITFGATAPLPLVPPMNVLFIELDGHLPQLHCNGQSTVQTPHVDGATPSLSQRPEAWLYDLDKWAAARKRFEKQQAPYATLVRDLTFQADRLLNTPLYTVTNKQHVPPSGNHHDYYSMGPYWWPNPDTDDGLPYIRKDGERNPEYEAYDALSMASMSRDVWILSQAYFYTGAEVYAQKAHAFLHTWFLDPETRMTPHLEYGQAIPGVVEGRGIGIIETGNLVRVVNAAGLLRGAAAFPSSTYQELQDWFRAYTHWLVTSEKGWDERRWHNNHGSSYDSQVASFALFVGEDSLARMILDSVKTKRIDRQIEADGSQPWELERTKSMSYNIKNLHHLIENAILAQHYDLDLWQYESAKGGSITQAIRFLIPYMMGEKPYPYQEFGGIENKQAAFRDLIWVAHQYLDDPLIQRAFEVLCSDAAEPLPIRLSYPLFD